LLRLLLVAESGCCSPLLLVVVGLWSMDGAREACSTGHACCMACGQPPPVLPTTSIGGLCSCRSIRLSPAVANWERNTRWSLTARLCVPSSASSPASNCFFNIPSFKPRMVNNWSSSQKFDCLHIF
jgi:hypothetical protein